ncbi:MAG: sugar ABC transporter ATP-binding protein [Spirochaetaceae bacterium]|jgi:ABC-type sugar transport system ATPase subunit|nr:sugar ABC transporter ATP-binding protein [Spirochaetaceae bacterium]
MAEILLEMRNISKSFPGVKALSDVSFNLKAGEIHSLIGENGAGKSTLIKCLGGQHSPDSGDIVVQGETVHLQNAHDSQQKRIGVIYQEFNLVPTLSIAENIYLGRENHHGIIIDRKTMFAEADKLLKNLGQGHLPSTTKVSSLTISQQQMIEISKAVSNNSQIMVFDEPTAVLTQHETDLLFEIIAHLKKQGVGIIYISHRLDEILQLSDRVTVLRDGIVTGTIEDMKDVTKDHLVTMMVGRQLEAYYPDREKQIKDDTVFEIKNLSLKGVFEDISLKLNRGEILGISGLVGAGRTETMKSAFGALPHDSGDVYLEGKKIERLLPRELIKAGVIYLPEDRKNEGLILSMSAATNLCVPNYDQISSGIWVQEKKKKAFVNKYFTQLGVRPSLPERLALNFSGGNQQKIIIAKWLARNPKVLMLDEPTRGIDVNAKAEIYKIMNDLTDQGLSVIMVSSEMPELIGTCDRIMVMYEGKFVAEFNKKDGYDEHEIGRAQTGVF